MTDRLAPLAAAIKHAEDSVVFGMSKGESERSALQLTVAAIASTRPPDVWRLAGILASELLCNVILQALGSPQLDARELGTVLAALRYWQRTGGPEAFTHLPEDEIASNGNTVEPLTADEIDALCERINK